MHLEPARIRSWKDMMDAFIKQYQYNLDMAPDRLQLQGMEKKKVETFKVCSTMERSCIPSGASS